MAMPRSKARKQEAKKRPPTVGGERAGVNRSADKKAKAARTPSKTPNGKGAAGA